MTVSRKTEMTRQNQYQHSDRLGPTLCACFFPPQMPQVPHQMPAGKATFGPLNGRVRREMLITDVKVKMEIKPQNAFKFYQD